MKITALFSVALAAATTVAGLDVGSVISEFYPTQTPVIKPAQSTSLASALYSVQSTWFDSPSYTSVRDAIYSAAPSSVQSSLSASGWRNKEITTQPWYTKNVPKAQQTALAKEVSALDSAAAKIIGTPSKNAGAVQTGLPMVVGAIGLVGAALL